MSRKITFCMVAVLGIASLVAAACAPTPTPEETVEVAATAPPEPAVGEPLKIPFVGPLTGPDGVDGQGAANAAQLAVNLINEAGGVCGGRMLEFEAYDTKADPKEGVNIATQLCADEAVLGVVADYNSSVALAEAPVFNECGVVQLNYYAAAPDIPKIGGEWTFRAYPPGQNQSIYLADWLTSEGYTKIGCLYENTDYGLGLHEAFKEEIAKLGGECVAEEAVLKDQTDLSAVISKFKAAGSEAVVAMIQYQVGAYWATQAADLDLEAPLYGADGLYAPEIIRLGGEHVEGVKTVAAYLPTSTDPVIVDFVQNHTDAFGKPPNNPGGYAYDAVNLIAVALDGSDCSGREGVRDWLANNVEDIAGITGATTFDEYGERGFAPGMYIPIEIQNGEWVEVAR